MNRSMLAALPGARDLTLDQLRARDPALAEAVVTLVRRAEATRLKEALSDLPEHVRAKVGAIDVTRLSGDPVEHLRVSLTSVDRKYVTQVVNRARKVKLGQGLRPGQPIGSEPAVAMQIAIAGVHEVSEVAGLGGGAADALTRIASAPSGLDDATLTKLVSEKKLTEAQARNVGFSAALYQLVDGNAALATAIRTASFPRLGGKPPTSTADLARLSGADWASFFRSSKTLSNGAAPETVGAALAARMAAVHPGLAMTGRLPQIDAVRLLGDIRVLAPLLEKNKRVIGAGIAELDTAGLTSSQLADLRAMHARLVQLVRAYPGLDLASIVDDHRLGPEAKANIIGRRVGLVQQVSAQLGETHVTHLDLSVGSADLARLGLDKLGATADEQHMVLSTFRAYQRVGGLTGSVDDAHALLYGGFTSAMSIGRQTLAGFKAAAGFDIVKAKHIWDRARSAMADVTLTAASMLDAIHGLFDELGVGNQPRSAEEYLKKLAGFQDLFGNVSFCACEECQSILGPAAYFVDLMKYIDENLRTVFVGKPNHPLDLKTRRPDLWTLELSCGNTNGRVPTLDIVNEILENYVARRALGYAGSLGDRAAVRSLVYGQALAKPKPAQTIDSFHQPFHLPLARIGAYLAALGHTRAEIADALGAPSTARVQAQFGLSSRERELVTQLVGDLGRLSHVYGIQFGGSANSVAAVDAQVLGPAMGLTRNELGQLVATRFAAAGGAHVSILLAKRDASSVQNDVEWVNGLTADALDRMYRFARLVRKTRWSIADLDLVLATSGATTLGAQELEAVAGLHAMQARLGETIAVQCALIGAIPDRPVGESLFDRLFNAPSFVAADGVFPRPAARFIHPAFRQSTPAPIDPALPRLLAGLAVDVDALESLARHLAQHLAQESSPKFDPDATTEEDRYFVLSSENLALLYRHARLAQILSLSIDDLFEILGFVGLDRVAGLSDLVALVDLETWWRSSGYRLDDVAVSIGQAPRDASRYADAASVAAQIVGSAPTALMFSDTVFAVALGTTEQGSRDLLAKNSSVVESLPAGTWCLAAGIDIDTVPITVPSTATIPTPPSGTRLVTADEVREALRPHLAAEVLVRSLGSALGLTTDKTAALCALVGQSLTTDAVVKAVRGDGPVAPLTALVSAILPVVPALGSPAWDASAINFLRLHGELFSAANESLPHLVTDAQHPNAPFVSLAQLRAISTYARLAQRKLGAAPDAPTGSPGDLQGALAAFDAAVPGFPSSSDPAISQVLGVPSGILAGLRGRVALPAVAMVALDHLDRAAQFAVALGVSGETFGALVSDDPDALSQAADALVAALGARYTDDATRAAKVDEAEQAVRAAKRDALADYLIHSITPQVWRTVDDLYQYFLIDVAAGGCATTSRVVAATMSAQLYVQRAIMNLEQDDLPASDPKHIVVSFKSDPTVNDNPAAEWAWRKNYRVWQANRKVFLWPENYLDPDLRDDKTPLFKELEQELLQTDINDQNVLDAYTKYLAGLEDVASLTVAGAYHDVSPNSGGQVSDVLHLFGATAADPPIYYYRTCENLRASGRDANTGAVWSPWQKITVQITGRKVSPVVHEGRLYVFWIDIKTRSVSEVKKGTSNFAGYRHKMSLRFTMLRPDRTWTAPQEVALPDEFDSFNFGPGHGQVKDPLSGKVARLDPKKRKQSEALDDYTLSGPNWDWVWLQSTPSKLRVQLRNFLESEDVDIFSRRATGAAWGLWPPPYPELLHAKTGTTSKPLYHGIPSYMVWTASGFANAIIDEERMAGIELEGQTLKNAVQSGFSEKIATIPASTDLLAVPGSEEDGLLQVRSDVLLLQSSVTDDSSYVLRRLGTTLVVKIARRLFEDGLDSLLATKTQLGLAEAGLPITLVGGRIKDHSGKGQLDFKGPYGVYYGELFFHVPFLIANALSSRGRFEAAQRWYHYIFDPTAAEVIETKGVPPAEVAHRLLDRVWRYREFRGLDVARLRDILTDKLAIALYRNDPFNPWAIARRRISAFQKAIVMKYVGNLLDWADSLFSQFTMESVNEAMMLYITASDVLGARPAELGDCGAGNKPCTYEAVGPMVDGSSEILAEIETWIVGARVSAATPSVNVASKYAIDHSAIVHAVERYPIVVGTLGASESVHAIEPSPAAAVSMFTATPEGTATAAGPVRTNAPGSEEAGIFRGFGWNDVRTASWGPALDPATSKAGARTFDHARKTGFSESAGSFGWSLVRQLTPVFCVPPNTQLLALWDRVEDRLYKIRHCMDIDGQKRELALFAPPIDPMDLVAMKAAGLGLDDVLGAGSGHLPPYRFLYLVERAKAFAASLGGFGATLLSALEKKDGEQLNRLRLTQQLNMVRMMTQTRQLEIQVATESLEALNRQQEATRYRSEFYAGLIAAGRIGPENVESSARKANAGIVTGAVTLRTLAGILKLTPEVGSPFAMKYGGVALGGSTDGFGAAVEAASAVTNAIATAAGLEASFARRVEGWKNQKTLADFDIKSLDRQIRAAEIRLDIATRALTLHEKSIDQMQEMLDLTDSKFTKLGLYTWMSTQLQRMYRDAYQNALALAKLAEQAYRFERGDDTLPGLAPSYWDATHAGLLAGERLLVALQTLERRYLETNYRTLEVDQAFALSQVDAQALVNLRETGECTFTVSEVLFDLFYPGHYKRRIKAVRLTIPCITGPYVNVSASLSLEKSWIRPTAELGAALVEVPPSRSVSIATSTAQNDAGVFELSFRDERYMPFEGLGAISQWRLALPKAFRQFDYETINDVMLSISYTAEQNADLRARVEAQSSALEGSIVSYFSKNSARRLFSLRQDFSGAFSRLLRSPAGTQIKIELTDKNFPLFVRGRGVTVQRGVVLLRTAAGTVVTGFRITIDGMTIDTFSADATLGNLAGRALPAAFTSNLRGYHMLSVDAAGDLAPTSAGPGDGSAVDAGKLLDVLLYLEYRLV